MAHPTAAAGRRLPNLDVLRGAAALIVLVGHAYGLGGSKVPLAAESLRDAVLMLSPVGVWLFFVVSGLVIGRPFVRAVVEGTPVPRLGAYAARRVARLYPLYLVCAAAVLVTIGAGGVGLGTVTAHLTLLHNLLPDRQQAFISVTWTLTLEVLFYAAVPLLAGLILARRRGPVPATTLARWIVLSALASVAWMLVAGALPSSLARTSLFARQLLPSMWSAFCPGLLIALAHLASPDDLVASPILRTVHRLRSHAPSAMAVGFGFAALGFLTFFAQPRWGTTAYLWTYDLGRVCWSVAFAVLVLRAVDAMALPDRTPQALVALGDWSYGIYVIHGTLFTIMLGYGGRALFPMPHGGAPAFLVHVAYLAALTIPLAALSWRFLEKPAMVAARRVGAPPVAPVAAGR